MLKLALEDFIAAIPWELHVMEASIDTRALLIRRHTAKGVVCNTVHRDLMLKATEATLGQALAAS